MISGEPATVHHVRRFGESKNDRRTLPLAERYHLIGFGPYTSIEALGKAEFQRRYEVNLENAILDYNARYERECATRTGTNGVGRQSLGNLGGVA